MKIKRFLPVLFLFFLAAPARAVVLRVLVSEVPDGKTVIVVIGPNRDLTVVLKGIDAPDLKQEYGDVARQHLASLVLNKEVILEFTELRSRNVVGKVSYNRVDIGLQVVRDGVAWYDQNNSHDLVDSERGLYAEAEQAARKEQRGLWQDGSPMPPWEWRRAQAAKVANLFNYQPARASTRALSSEDVVLKKKTASRNSKGAATATNLGPKPPSRALNQPGDDFDFSSYLTRGRYSIVYFYADWCPSCRQLSPIMATLNAKAPEAQVVFMNIGDWRSALTQRYEITYVPYFRIYDKSGALIAEGHAARSMLQQSFLMAAWMK